MVKNLFLCMAALFMASIFLHGCAFHQPEPKVQVVQKAVEEEEFIEAEIVVGSTTKQYLLDKLGTPDDISESSFRYKYYNSAKLSLKLHIVYADGTTMNLIIGKKYKHSSISISFDGKHDKNGQREPTNVVSDIYL